MKTTKLIRCALFAAVLVAFGFAGCQKLDFYSIDAPSDLQSKIDSIAAAKASMDTGDTTYIDIIKAIVGAEDYSTTWWNDHSDFFGIPTNQLLHLEFINHTPGTNNWNNWNLCVANVAANASKENDEQTNLVVDASYEEYFVLRSDAYGWGNSDYDGNLITKDYPDTDGDGDVWNDFRTTMDGAYVTLIVDHSATGNVYVTATAVGTNGTTITETYHQPVSATEDIYAFIVTDASYFEMKKAYLLPSEVTEIADVNPVSIAVKGAPTFVEMGNEDYWGNAIATVTFADGSTEQVDTTDLSITIVPDMVTIGTTTVVVSYNKTKQGEFCDPVTTFYTLEIANSVASLEVTTMPDVTTYTFPGPVTPVFDPTGLVVTATYSDGTTGVIANDNLQFVNPGGDGAQDVVITYVGETSTVTTTCPITNVTGGTNQVGPTDFASTWWTSFSNEYTVASSNSVTFKMKCYSSGANNWNSPLVVLRKADLTEYAVVRMDSWGWGSGYENNDNLVVSSDWDWDTFLANINDSYVEITVTNVGDGTANIRYDVTYANSDTHYQLYEGITVNSSDLNCAITIDGCYVDITSVE